MTTLAAILHAPQKLIFFTSYRKNPFGAMVLSITVDSILLLYSFTEFCISIFIFISTFWHGIRHILAPLKKNINKVEDVTRAHTHNIYISMSHSIASDPHARIKHIF